MSQDNDKDGGPPPLLRFRARMESLWAFLKLLSRQFVEDGCQSAAAALTYTTLFAIVPIMTVSFAIISSIPALDSRSLAIQEWVFEYFVPSSGHQILQHLNEFSHQAAKLTGVGILFLVVTAVLMLRTIEQTLNRIWKIRQPRKGATSLLTYWAVLSLGPLLLGVGLGISSYLTSVSLLSHTVAWLGGARFWLSLLPFFLTTATLSLLYIVVPNTAVPYREGVLGAAIAALLFELAKAAFAEFVKHAPNYQVVYGAFAAVPLFLLWIYISWVLVLLGAELVRALVVFQEHRRKVPRLQALLRLLHVFWKRQREGRELPVTEVRRVLAEAGISHWDEFCNLMHDCGLIRRTEDGGYVLCRDLRSLSLARLLAMMPWPLEQQLKVNAPGRDSWESVLKARCEQAREGLNAPLDFSLDALFEARIDMDARSTDPPTAEADNTERTGQGVKHG